MHGGFGGPAVKFTQFNGDFGLLVGGQGGWIINHTFALGAGGYGLVTDHHPMSVPAGYPWAADQSRTDMGYGGVILSYIGMSDQLMHPTLDVLIGGGSIHGHRNDLGWDYDDEYDHMNSDAFFVLEPTANVELNLLSFMRFNAGAGYRIVSGVSEWGFSNEDVSGFSGSLGLKFGKF
jgi:hypothetical protein